ncbi:hypothetical protein [Pontibacter cellulosilyticus]|uniref:Septum formation inhibitor Maf n=1 Tax=Pontibacter cellulosilyticus TaxID=1720253 RepID=A0A923NCD1_9BACT|nr:hypothetical protein [Pontibacter cellulosilyticus]MBC5994340.1 hypothetical protein [Pontibacter cellulosilyticus]
MPRHTLLAGLLWMSIAAGFSSCTSQGANTTSSVTPTKDYSILQQYFNPNWATDTLWDDGLAEVAVYDAERVIYDKKRSFEFALITVKEDFNRTHNVKTDDYSRQDLFPVMKVNEFARIETDNYPYHYLTSVFVHRSQPWALHKLTTSSQEWCGTTFKSITDEGTVFQQEYNSYFDGQGSGSRELPKTILAEDQLPYTLRALRFSDELSFKANVLELQQTNQAKEPKIYKANIRTVKAAVNGQPAWEVQVQLDENKQNTYYFAAQYPNQLIRQRTWDGRNLELKKLSRYAYWERPKA